MTDWNSSTVNAHIGLANRLLFMISFGFWLYDSILSAPFDWSIISGKRQRRLPQLAYFGTKIFYLTYIILSFVVNFTYHEIDCNRALEMVEMLMGFTVVTSSILLACRTICVYEGPVQKFVAFTLTILCLGVLAAWMENVTSVNMPWQNGAGDPWTDGACVAVSVAQTYWVKYVCTIIFDAIVLFLTVFGLLQMSGPSHIGAVLLRQGIVYFLITFIANLMITIFTALKLSASFSLLLAVPQTTTCVIAACRLYIDLAMEARSSHEASQQTQSYADRLRYSGGGGNVTTDQSFGSKSKTKKSRLTNYLFRKDGGVQDTTVPSYFSSTSDSNAANPRQGMVQPKRNVSVIREKNGESSQPSSQESHDRVMVNNNNTNRIPVVTSAQTMQTRLSLDRQESSHPATTGIAYSSDEDIERQASRSNVDLDQNERFYDPPQTPSGAVVTPAPAVLRSVQEGNDGNRTGYFTQPISQPTMTRIPPRNSSGIHLQNGQRLRAVPASSIHQDDGVQVETVNYVVVENAPAYTPPLSTSHHQTRYASPRPYNPYDPNNQLRRPGTGDSRQQQQNDDEVVILQQPQQQQPRFVTVRREPPRA